MKKFKEGNLIKATFFGMMWSGLGTLIQGISQFIVLIILTRLVTPYDFGVISAGLVLISFSVIFATLGVGPAIIQREKLKDRHIYVAYTLSILTGTFIMLLLWVNSKIISNFFNIPELVSVIKVLSVIFFVKGFAVVSISLMQRDLNFRKTAKIQVLSYTLGYGLVSITLAVMGLGYWALVVGYISQSVLESLLSIIARPHSKKLSLDKRTVKEIFFFGGGHTIGRIFNYFAIHGDNLMVGRLLGAEMLGIYSRAYQLMVMPTTLLAQVIDKVLFSSMSKIQSNLNKLRKSYEFGLRLTAVFVMPISVVMFYLSEEIVLVLFGEKWINVVVPFQILAIGVFFRTSYKISDAIAQSTGHVYQRAWRQVIYALSVMIGAYIGHYWGLNGIVIAILLALVINYIMMTQLTMSIVKTNLASVFKIHFPSIIISISLVVQIYFFLDYLYIINSPFFRMLFAIVMYFANIVLFFKYLVGKEIYDSVKVVINKTRKRILNEENKN